MEPTVDLIRIPGAVSARRIAKQLSGRRLILDALLLILVTNGFGPQRGSLT
jgi:hypothetical protein